MPLLPQDTVDAVRQDGQPRLAVADDQTRHVVYLQNGFIRSELVSDAMTQPEINALLSARLGEETQHQQDTTALRQRVRTLAQSAVGQPIDTLTGPQVRALLVVLLHKEGAIDRAGVVRPLSEWG